MNKITLTLYVDRSDHELLKAAAEAVDRPISNYCRHVLTAHARTIDLDKLKKPAPQTKTPNIF
jgi:uncharacterized protein (DUF1778 family)